MQANYEKMVFETYLHKIGSKSIKHPFQNASTSYENYRFPGLKA